MKYTTLLTERSFTLIGGSNYKCKICGQLAECEWSGAKWAIEFNCDTKIASVWHEGKHECVLKCQSISKEEKEAKKDLLNTKTVLCIFPRLLKTKLIDVGAQYYIQCGYPDIAKEFVQACMDKQIVSQAQTESYAELLGMDQHSVHAVAIIKNKMDTVDPFYIYKMIASGMILAHVFKCSQTAAEIGLAMDRTARQTPFRELVVHMDGLHSCVKGFVMLTLWVTNPTSLITHHLTCMECESENTQNVTLFLQLYNKILLKVKGDSSYGYYDRREWS